MIYELVRFELLLKTLPTRQGIGDIGAFGGDRVDVIQQETNHQVQNERQHRDDKRGNAHPPTGRQLGIVLRLHQGDNGNNQRAEQQRSTKQRPSTATTQR